MPGRGYETRWKPMVNCTKVLEVAGELKRSAHLAGPHLPDWARMSLIRCYFHTFLSPPSLSSSSSYSLILNDHSMESEYRLFVLFPSLSLCDLLIVMACRWATNPPWHAKSPSLLPPTGWRTYKTRSCRKSDIWNFHMLLHTIILLLSKSCREVDCLFSVPFYATYLLLLHHGLAVLNALQKLALARGKCSGCARFYIIYVCIKMSTPSYRHLCEKKTTRASVLNDYVNSFSSIWAQLLTFFLLDYHKVYGLDNEITLTYYKRKK